METQMLTPTPGGDYPRTWIGIQPRQWHIAARLIHVADDGAAPALFDEAHAFPDEGGGAEAVVFGDAPPYGVVVKARAQPE